MNRQQPNGVSPGLLPQLTGRAEGGESQSVEEAKPRDRQSAPNRITVDDIPKTGGHFHVLVDRHALDKAGENHAEQERRNDAADEHRPVPHFSPCGMVGFPAELKRCGAGNQCKQNERKHNIVSAEHRGIPMRKCGKHRSCRRNQPHFVRIPERPDRIDQYAALMFIASDQSRGHANTEIESFEEEKADKQHCNEQKPQIT